MEHSLVWSELLGSTPCIEGLNGSCQHIQLVCQNLNQRLSVLSVFILFFIKFFNNQNIKKKESKIVWIQESEKMNLVKLEK